MDCVLRIEEVADGTVDMHYRWVNGRTLGLKGQAEGQVDGGHGVCYGFSGIHFVLLPSGGCFSSQR